MATSPQASLFIQAIANEQLAVERFVLTLKQEQEALSRGAIDSLPEFAEQKNTLATHLTELASQRNTTLATFGLAPDRPGVEAWCSKHAEHKATQYAWAKILILASQAKELNRVNGELIRMRLQHNNAALDILLGKNSALDLYGPNGQSTGLGSGRINDAV